MDYNEYNIQRLKVAKEIFKDADIETFETMDLITEMYYSDVDTVVEITEAQIEEAENNFYSSETVRTKDILSILDIDVIISELK